ncbi:hypothetical protein HD806DRAFT_4799 [Xylariaceae sp. AK1471]|nr:hypothetical protein HD806DRAFT_4799 [Xylariaceae sp. AK1471]
MASPGTPKTMSSRLLTMKFMQRAAASTPSPSSTPITPSSNDQSNKRRKVSHSNTPQQNVDTLVNQAAIQAAIAEEEKKVESALLKRAEELGDARWVLEVPDQVKSHTAQTPLNIIQVGFGQIDSFDSTGNDTESAYPSHDSIPALRRYNMDKKKASKKPPNTNNDSSSSSDSESDFDSDSDASSSEETSGRQSFGSNPRTTSNTQPMARKILNGKKSAEQLKAMQFAEKRRQREVKLNNPKGRITSISSGGGPSPVNFICNNCGQPGHKALNCKKPGNRQGR